MRNGTLIAIRFPKLIKRVENTMGIHSLILRSS